jgi:TolA-binding protein
LTYNEGDFRNAFEEYQRVEDGIRNHFRNELKSKLQEVDKAMDETPKKHSIVRLIAWTSSVAAAIVIGVFIFQHFAKPNHIELAQNYWPHEEGLPVKMSDASQYDEAMNAFKLENWDKAESLLTAIDSDTSAYFLREIAYRKGDLSSAITNFSNVKNSSVYFHKAQFRLALLFLNSRDTSKAKEILIFLVDEKSLFADEAKEILRGI